MQLSIKDFLKHGTLGLVHLEMERAEVEAHLGKPDAWSTMLTKKHLPVIWKYGGIEIHFKDDEDTVFMIFIDDFDTFQDRVDLWILHNTPPVIEFEKALMASDIKYTWTEVPGLAADLYLITEAGVHLQFSQECDAATKLVACSLR